VPVEAQVGIEAGHADVEERLADVAARVGLAEAPLVPDPVVELDDVDVVSRGRAARFHRDAGRDGPGIVA
jgi:hypothetical protein